jgi:hypothetical protein
MKELAERAKKDGGSGADPKALEELAKELAEQDPKALEDRLRRLANEGLPPSAEAARQRKLDAAQGGLGAGPADPSAGGAPSGQGGAGGAGGPGRQPGGAGGDSAPGPSNKGPGKPTDEVAASDVRSKANAHMNGGDPNPGTTMGRGPSRAGETANARGTGALGDAAPDEIGGTRASDVPQEYRDQIGKYFQP